MPLPKYVYFMIKGKGKFEEKVPQTCEFCEHLSWRELAGKEETLQFQFH